MEAVLADCNLVLSTAGYECEYYAGHGSYCDPADPDSIREAVQTAWERYSIDAPTRKRLRSRIMHDYTWQRAAEAALSADERTLVSCSSRDQRSHTR
jgi:glycosyltransferase involved in cell wall biosynthesis